MMPKVQKIKIKTNEIVITRNLLLLYGGKDQPTEDSLQNVKKKSVVHLTKKSHQESIDFKKTTAVLQKRSKV